MRDLHSVIGERGLYDHNVTIIREVGGLVKVVRLRSVRKKGLEDNRQRAEKNAEEIVNYVKLEASTSRANRVVKEYALCNEWDWFVTLTLDKAKFDRYDLNAYHKAFGQFLHNYNRRCGEGEKVRYILIPEMHKDGAWHMHGLIKGIRSRDLAPNDNGYLEWLQYTDRFGYMSLGAIRDRQKVANYITKYITKDLSNSVKEYGAHLYYHSRGLAVGTELYRGHDVNVSCDWDYERPDGFCKVKWFDDTDSFADAVQIGLDQPKEMTGVDEWESLSSENYFTNTFIKGSVKSTIRNKSLFVQYAQKEGCLFYVTSCGRWRLKKPLPCSCMRN